MRPPLGSSAISQGGWLGLGGIFHSAGSDGDDGDDNG
jgi:hypothetical protein